MLNFRLSSILRMRGIDKPFVFMLKRGFHRTVTNNLINDRDITIKLSHLEKLCRALNCTPNENDSISADHPLNALKREQSSANFLRMYKEIPLDKLHKVEEFLS